MKKFLIVLATTVALVGPVVAGDALICGIEQGHCKRLSITTQLFDESGTRIGMAVQVGDTTTFYVDGKKTGSSKTIGRRTIYYDARGKKAKNSGL